VKEYKEYENYNVTIETNMKMHTTIILREVHQSSEKGKR